MIAVLMELLGPLLPWIGGAVAGLALFWGHGRRERKKGRQEAVSEAHKDKSKREERGRHAVAKEKSETSGLSNRDLIDRLRGRDGDWGGL